MSVTIKISVFTNGDDAFVAWAPSNFIPECRGFLLERERIKGTNGVIEIVENRLGFEKDKPKSGDHKPSNFWPLQRFNWTDHAVDIGNKVRYRITAMTGDVHSRPFSKGPSSNWSPWVKLSSDVGDGFSCYFNRGLILSQFVARYLKAKKLSTGKFKAQLKKNVDPKFRDFLAGELGLQIMTILKTAKTAKQKIHAALYELDDEILENNLISLHKNLHLILANGSGGVDDQNQTARNYLNSHGIVTIDRMLKSKGLGHNKFLVLSNAQGPIAIWSGSTNWSTTGLCTQINNGILIKDKKLASHYFAQWNLLKQSSPPALSSAGFPPALVSSNDKFKTFNIGKSSVKVWFTRTSNGNDMKMLSDLIGSAKSSILFLMFTPGTQGLHTLAGERANEKTMYVRGVVSTLGNTKEDNDKNVLEINLISSAQTYKPDHYSVIQPQSIDNALGPWIAEVTRKNFLSQIGHAIVHSKVMIIDGLSKNPIVITGSHNFSTSASKKNDENLLIIHGHSQLAKAYSAYVMSVYSHYRYKSYVREMIATGKKPWSYLDDNDYWLKQELKSKAQEIDYWTT